VKLRTEWHSSDMRGRDVFLADDVRVPAALTATFEFEQDHTFALELAMREGHPVCERVEVARNPARGPLTGDELRRIPLANWIEFAYTGSAMIRTHLEGTVGTWEPIESEEEVERVADLLTRSRRRNAITDTFLRDVAKVYREHEGAAPTAAVKEAFLVSHSTAARYVRLARERGHLPKPTAGKATR
jgi:hypothetical protein